MQITVPFSSYPKLRFLAVIAGLLGTVSDFIGRIFLSILNHRLSFEYDKLLPKVPFIQRTEKVTSVRVPK